jgi:hypothetical protein
LLVGAVKVIVAEVFVERFADNAVGAPGAEGVKVSNGGDACEGTDVPIEFLAVTRTR